MGFLWFDVAKAVQEKSEIWEPLQEYLQWHWSEAEQTCCCCRKPLTTVESRTRGIGPECIRMFKIFGEPPPSKVEKYRQKCLAKYHQTLYQE